MGHARAGRGHGSTKHGRRGGKEGEQNVGSAPEGGPGPCVRGAPYHPGGASGQAPPRGFRRTERHCKWAGDGIRVRWAWRSGLALRGPESLAAPPLRTPGRGDPYHLGGASRQVPPREFRRTERHCKWAGDGTRVPWAPHTGIAQRGHESRAALPLCTGGRSAGREDGARTGRQGARKRQARTPRWEGRGAERRQCT
ncbi:hypothetical protein COCNU_scaffold068551G000010 [Cocos nucifera]|nr:hypothetical protein [Cocos nucifera]